VNHKMAIITPDQRLRVFVSSTLQELTIERAIVKKTIQRLRLTPVLFELGASPHPPRELYRAYLAQSQVFIGIYWQRYGWVAPGMQVSGLEDEFLLSSGMPRLIYVKSPAFEREPGLTEMIKRIENEGSVSYKKFSTPKELGALIAGDLAVLLSERFDQSRAMERSDPRPPTKLTNLPTELTPFIGREQQLASVCSQLKKPSVRLVTLTGPGGVGKTRLALRAASSLLDSFPDGAWLVELAPLSDSSLIAGSIASAIGIREEMNQSLLQTLVDYFRDRCLLLVMDNAEHMIQEAAEITEKFLRSSPGLHIIATSREPFGIAGELVYSIPPLSLPDPGKELTLDRFTQFEAVHLFVDRAAAVRVNFTLTEKNRAAVAQICTRLDGIPLAIELAAARVRAMSVEEIATRLDERFNLLVGSRTAAPRQQTLRALFDWSFTLLSEGERILLRRLSIFPGSWNLPAAEEICLGGGIEKSSVLNLLTGLIDKSLVSTEEADCERRYHFLQTIRDYSQERLAESDEYVELSRRHAEYFANLTDRFINRANSAQQDQWLARLETEHDNLTRALEWLNQDENPPECLLRMAISLGDFWEIRGHINEGRAWIERALAKNIQAPPDLRARGLHTAGNLATRQGDFAQSRAMHEGSLALFIDLNDQPGIAYELDSLGEVAHALGDLERAVDLCNESLAIRYEISDKEGIAQTIGHLGIMAREQGRYQFAKDMLEEGLDLCRELENPLLTAQALKDLGLVAFYRNQYGRAKNLLEESVGLFRDLNDRAGISDALQNLGSVAKDLGEFQLAKKYYNDCLEIAHVLGDRRGLAQANTSLAEVAFYQGYYPCAAKLAAQGHALFQDLGIKRGILYALGLQAFIAHYQGDYDRAHDLANDCIALATELNSPRAIAYAKEVFGLRAYVLGDYDTAAALFREALGIFQKVFDYRNVTSDWVNLARTAYRQGNQECAMHYLNDSMAIATKLEIQWALSYVLEIMGLLQRSLGNLERASALFKESLQISVRQENQQGIANCLGALAGIAVGKNHPEPAVRLFAYTDKIRVRIGAKMGKDDLSEYHYHLELARNQLDAVDFKAAWDEGYAMTAEQIASEAVIHI
jgi:predicted ATPase